MNSLMAFQAGLPALDYGGLRGQAKREYSGAIHAAMVGDYVQMEQVFGKVLQRSRRLAISSSSDGR